MAWGDNLGAALNALLRAHGAHPGDRLKSYRAKSWHAQLVQLTSTARGYAALEAAGLTVKPRTLASWLADEEYQVRSSYRTIIARAYEAVATIPPTPVPQSFKDNQFEIRGVVKTGADERDRGADGTAPLRIDGRNGNWDAIETKWLAGVLTDEEFEDCFINDVVVEDIGEGTDGWEFSGSSYNIT
ncbi:hypothetical protein [Streptomyces sp. NBC_00859]|uniref:hypothetical protein n=1 Tax=Streptomyces sp. NBC_00859 TaxID=2903682 RepID=UPI0038666B72|nr:hypothetical protein OG584_00080 [Streptomyces sp. NBC_00859]WSZ86780.1 hypothetical protein OG584_35055 [Streptomyces sp. NBC_00859]